MDILTACGPKRCAEFLAVENDASPKELSVGMDLFVGAESEVTITVPNQGSLEFRDIVVWGKMTLGNEDDSDTEHKGRIVARDVISGGNLAVQNINITARNVLFAKSRSELRSQLGQVVLNHLNSQDTLAESGTTERLGDEGTPSQSTEAVFRPRPRRRVGDR